MNGEPNPPFIEQDGNAQIPSPYSFSGLLTYGFPLAADAGRLTALCNRYLNLAPAAETGFEYRPLAPLVYLQLNLYPKMVSEVPEFRRMGFCSQLELAFSLPVVKWVPAPQPAPGPGPSPWVPSEVSLFTPYCFVDNPWSMASGRDVLGYPKIVSWFQMPSKEKEDPYPIRTDAMVYERYTPETRLNRRLVTRITKKPGAPEPPARPDKAFGIFGPVEDLFGSRGPFSVEGDVFPLLEQAAVSWHLTQFKQFRDAADPYRACYQAIVDSTMRLAEPAGGGLLPPGDVEIRHYASLPIAEALGLVLSGGKAEVLSPYWLAGDYVLEETTNLYVRSGAATEPVAAPGTGRRGRRRREDPERQGPIRDWTGWFRGPGAWGFPNPFAAGEPGPEGPEKEEGGGVSEVVSEGVELGYRVIEEHIRQGQRVAQKLNDRTYGPGDMGADLQELTQRVMRDSADFVALWFDLVGSMTGSVMRDFGRRRDPEPPEGEER